MMDKDGCIFEKPLIKSRPIILLFELSGLYYCFNQYNSMDMTLGLFKLRKLQLNKECVQSTASILYLVVKRLDIFPLRLEKGNDVLSYYCYSTSHCKL